MAKHSPGPWSIHGDNKTLIGDNSGKMMVADVLHKHICPQWNRPLEEAQANAKLIAAAPDLLACIEDFISAYSPSDGGEMSWEMLNDVLSRAIELVGSLK
jgi:hypothetical protein